MADRTPGREHAIVVGGGHAGLLAARVLADHFAKVTIVERDRLGPDTTFRAGVPQGYHPHFLMAKGAQIIDGLFPGLLAELDEAGAPFFDHGEGLRLEFPSGWTPRTTTGIVIQGFSRPLLEQRIRRRVTALENVTMLDGFTVDRLLFEHSPLRASGISGRDSTGAGADLTADLVVTASGRGSRLGDWLRDAGVSMPETKRIDVKVSYTSRTYQGPPDDGWKVTFAYVYAPLVRRGGGILELESGTCMAMTMGIEDEGCPPEEDAFLKFAGSLNFSNMADYIGSHKPLNDLHRFVDHGDRWLQVHRAGDWPAGLVVIGDALCRFNPIYGQGLTVAAMHARVLQTVLLRDGTARDYHRRAARVTRVPWLMATSSDLHWDTETRPGAVARLSHWHLDRVIARMPGDPDLFRRFSLVQHMLAGPGVLATPSVLVRLFRRPRPAIQRDV
jgi:2-polyprenyl-6-methoxyphenol hydroxylase-like FAD-dependent oxidoreductase